MKIEEAKQKANKDDEVVSTLLSYISMLENEIKQRDIVSKAHQQLVGGLYRQIDER
jgi:hypothetical protein